MTPIKAGDEVRVFDVNGKRRNMPLGGWPAEVVKVGRALVTIRCAGNHGEQVFRLDSQQANDNYGHQWFRMLDEVALMQRRSAAIGALRAIGLSFTSSGYQDRLTLDQIEALAEVARTFTDSPTGSDR